MPKHVLGIECGVQHVTMVQVTGTPKAYSVTAALQEAWPQASRAGERPYCSDNSSKNWCARTTCIIVTTIPAQGAVLRNLAVQRSSQYPADYQI